MHHLHGYLSAAPRKSTASVWSAGSLAPTFAPAHPRAGAPRTRRRWRLTPRLQHSMCAGQGSVASAPCRPLRHPRRSGAEAARPGRRSSRRRGYIPSNVRGGSQSRPNGPRGTVSSGVDAVFNRPLNFAVSSGGRSPGAGARRASAGGRSFLAIAACCARPVRSGSSTRGQPGRGRARVRVTESRSLSSAACTTSCFTCGVPEMTGPKAGREMTAKGAIRAAIDVGGTFTDDGGVRLEAARLVVLDADPEVSRERGC